MASNDTPWADTPFALIPTPGRGEDVSKLPNAIWIARDMCCAHNNMLRALNSVYQQAPYVTKPQDIKDLFFYAQSWCSWLEEHHEGEETLLFPQIEAAAGVEGLMAANVAQHNAFLGGLHDMQKYVTETSVDRYDGRELRAILNGFGSKLAKHLSDEIKTLLGLERYDTKKIRTIYDAFDLEMRKGDKSILFPIVLGSADSTFEGGPVWPEVPGFVRYLVHYVFERKHQGAWRFSPSTTWGAKRPLQFTAEEN